MFKFNSNNKTYIYDGSFEGLLTIVFISYTSKELPFKIISNNEYEINVLDSILEIKTNYEKSQRIFNGITKNISYDALYNCYYAFLSSSKNKELNIVKYLVYGFMIGPKIDTMLSIDFVFNVQSARKRMLGESHKLKGLLRFSKLQNNIFYSPIHPDNNIIENLGHHFMKRLPKENFIIHDKNRNIAFIYNTNEYRIVNFSSFDIPKLSKQEVELQDMWRVFFNTIAIKERKNPKLQMQYMPKKYWKDLTEI